MTELAHAAPITRSQPRSGAIRQFFIDCPPIVILALGWMAIMLMIALFVDHLVPFDFKAINVKARLLPPALFGGDWTHPMGTDQLGRDVLSRVMYSIRISMTIAICATMLSTFIGIALGFLAAYFRGWVDQLIQIIVDTQLALPFLIVAIAVLAFVGDSLLVFVMLLGFSGWEGVARISRGLAISANAQGYAAAARDIGCSPGRVYLIHILPNIAATIVVGMTLNIPGVILLESSLSFLGIGVQPPETSLGNMVGYGREYIQSAPWVLLAPSVIIILTTLSVATIGDWQRDRMDPTLG